MTPPLGGVLVVRRSAFASGRAAPKHEQSVAIRTFHTPATFEREIDTGMAERAPPAVAGNILSIDHHGLGRIGGLAHGLAHRRRLRGVGGVHALTAPWRG